MNYLAAYRICATKIPRGLIKILSLLIPGKTLKVFDKKGNWHIHKEIQTCSLSQTREREKLYDGFSPKNANGLTSCTLKILCDIRSCKHLRLPIEYVQIVALALVVIHLTFKASNLYKLMPNQIITLRFSKNNQRPNQPSEKKKGSSQNLVCFRPCEKFN